MEGFDVGMAIFAIRGRWSSLVNGLGVMVYIWVIGQFDKI